MITPEMITKDAKVRFLNGQQPETYDNYSVWLVLYNGADFCVAVYSEGGDYFFESATGRELADAWDEDEMQAMNFIAELKHAGL